MAKRGKNLAALAALGALGYMATRGENYAPVRDAVAVGTRAKDEDERDGIARREPSIEELARGSRDLEGGITPQSLNEYGERYSLESEVAPARRNRPASVQPKPSVRGQIIEKDKSTASTSPGTMGAYVSRAGTRTGPAVSSPTAGSSSAAAQIPSSGTRRVASDQDASLRVDSDSDAQRNISNIFNALPQGRAVKAVKSATQAARLNRPGTVSGQGFVVRDYKDPSAVAQGVSKETLALPAPRADYRSLAGSAREDAKAAEAYGKLKKLSDKGPSLSREIDEVNDRYIRSLNKTEGLKRGGAVKKMASGGSTNSASRRGDGIAQRGKTKGRMV